MGENTSKKNFLPSPNAPLRPAGRLRPARHWCERARQRPKPRDDARAIALDSLQPLEALVTGECLRIHRQRRPVSQRRTLLVGTERVSDRAGENAAKWQ
jgi:hypothetical protein